MASFTIEDIEFIRGKSGISYEEAIALLDYHNGDVMRALVDLERNGKLKMERASAGEAPRASSGKRGSFWSTRLVITGNGKVVANVSILFVIIAALVSFWLVLGALVACVFLGYRISISTISDDTNDRLDRMVKNAAENVKRTATGFAKGVSEAIEHRQEKAQTRQQPVVKKNVKDFAPDDADPVDTPESFVQEMEEREKHDAPTIQVPVKVESSDGNVVLTTDEEGFGTATIE